MSEAPPNVMRIADYGGTTSGAVPVENAASPVEVLNCEQLRERDQGVMWLIKHWLALNVVGVLFGASGTFKSFIALAMALHIAHGLPWLGKKTRQGPVVYIAAEGGTGLWRRIVAWHRKHRLPWKDAPIYVVPMAVDLAADAAQVRYAVEALGVTPVLVVIDTLSQTFVGEENSAQEVSVYLRELSIQFRACWQCAVLVVHHTGHNATERPRGSSALRANVDFMCGVFRDEKEMLATVEWVKQKDGELPAAKTFQLEVVELAKDEDGDPITSLVAYDIGSGADVVDYMKREASHGRGGRNTQFLELAFNGIEEKKLRTLFCESIDGDGESKRKAYYRARKWAVSAGLIEVREGHVLRIGGGT